MKKLMMVAILIAMVFGMSSNVKAQTREVNEGTVVGKVLFGIVKTTRFDSGFVITYKDTNYSHSNVYKSISLTSSEYFELGDYMRSYMKAKKGKKRISFEYGDNKELMIKVIKVFGCYSVIILEYQNHANINDFRELGSMNQLSKKHFNKIFIKK